MKFIILHCIKCGAIVNIEVEEFKSHLIYRVATTGTGDITAYNDVVPCCGDTTLYQHPQVGSEFDYGHDLPANVELTDEPEYKTDRFDYIISEGIRD